MAGFVPWALALLGIGLGGLVALVPGLPGGLVALLGLAAFAAWTDFTIVDVDALGLAAVFAGLGALAQAFAPLAGVRALGGASGAATGAALGAIAGLAGPSPLAPFLLGSLFGAVGAWVGRATLWERLRAWVGVGAGIAVAIAADLLAVAGVAAVLGAADFVAALGG